MSALFWSAAGLLLYTHIGYPLLLAALARRRAGPPRPPRPAPTRPTSR